ncbi:MAG TPA: helix-turn-helix domain-containing protein [Jatrophihabitans sp.]|jgi:AcrR family transcriptional regulator|uniref:TetR/AcrR family transcriptional regulator n=1 Tax=Jatrophihabitans sp. TaxID=1932789 RepID=UPI002DFF10A9|nr:helix-turn-helix domain-containing protein [Jatrophihabitans sp.]
MTAAPGKRALAKDNTRRRLRRAAMGLFLERGFDAVTTVEIAEAAEVSAATLFNYYATKEDLFFGQVEELEHALVEVVRACPPNESILRALQKHVLFELTAGRDRTDPASVAPFHRQVMLSPRLQAREHEIYDRRELVLADAITQAQHLEPGTLRPRVAARLYVAAEKLIADELRRQLTEVDTATALRDARRFIDDVFAILISGLGHLPAAAPPT